MSISTIQELAERIKYLADESHLAEHLASMPNVIDRNEFRANDRKVEEFYRKYLPKSGAGFRDYGVLESLRKYGYSGGFRNYADLTGYVVTMEDDPENLFYLRQNLEKRELLPIIAANGRTRPKHADFITLAAGIFAFTDKGDGSTLVIPVASSWGMPPATKAEPLGPEAMFDEKVRIARIQEIIGSKHGSWNYVHLAGQIVKRELVTAIGQENSWMRIVLKQHENDDSNIILYYTAQDAQEVMASCPIGSFVSIRSTYGSRHINGKIVPIIWATSIRACGKGDIYALMAGNREWMPRWVKALEKK